MSQVIDTAIFAEVEALLMGSQTLLMGTGPTIDFNDPKVQNHKDQFEKAIKEKYPVLSEASESTTTKKNTSNVIRKSEYDYTLDVLKGNKKISNHNKKHQFKKKCFSIIDGKLARTITDPTTRVSETKIVAYVEFFFEIIYDIHCIKRMHQGLIKIFDQVCERYCGVPRDAVNIFRQFCYVCDLNKKQMSQPRLTPIVSNQVFERVQIDLIDMRCAPDGEYNWIAHMEDHNSQLHVLWPQKHKSDDEVVDNIESRWFAPFGLPNILQR